MRHPQTARRPAYTYVGNNPILYVDQLGTTKDLAVLNQQRQDIVKQLLAAADSGADAIAAVVKSIRQSLDKLSDPETAAKVTGWLAGITGTLSVAALAVGQPGVAAVLGGASIVFTAMNMYYTDVQYRQGQMPAAAYYFSQAWNLASIGTGGVGLFARTLKGFMSMQEGALAAATLMARTLGWGGIALSHHRWRPR